MPKKTLFLHKEEHFHQTYGAKFLKTNPPENEVTALGNPTFPNIFQFRAQKILINNSISTETNS